MKSLATGVVGALLLLGILVCGCTTAPEEGGAVTGMVWVLNGYMDESGAMVAPLSTAPVTAEFSDGGMGGSGGCNSYSASYETSGTLMTIEMPVSTLMYCPAAGVMDQEQRYLTLLSDVVSYSADGKTLEMMDASGTTILMFEAIDQSLAGTTWLLAGYHNGQGAFVPVMAGTRVSAEFTEDGQITGNAGCNNYFGSSSADQEAISIGPLASTEMYCADPEGVMDQENAYLAAIQKAATYKVGAGELTLADASGMRLARYVISTETSVENLMEKEWRMVSFNNGMDGVQSAASGTVVSAFFGANGQVSGSAGCNNYFGTYTVSGDAIAIGPLGSTKMMCGEPMGVMEQESAFLAAMEASAMYAIEGNTLMLMDSGGATMVTFTEDTTALTGREWELTYYTNGMGGVVSLVPETVITATFGADGQVSGSAGCNNYFAGYTAMEGSLTVGPAGMTQMYCEEPGGVMDQETMYLQALEQSSSYQIRSGTLTIMDDAGTTLLVYR
jgi:heat shock protein HslJ